MKKKKHKAGWIRFKMGNAVHATIRREIDRTGAVTQQAWLLRLILDHLSKRYPQLTAEIQADPTFPSRSLTHPRKRGALIRRGNAEQQEETNR